ncbi:putative uncharacterized protein FLJ46214 [Lathamus discolor]|uniref:putative uncharacterized protein FLJ46214 n=1 Tax=Lathamus discolor TaxID=678569 RepID=UPI0032B7BDEB
MNLETGKSSSVSPFFLLGLPLQLPRRGDRTEKENVSLLPIRTCKQKANHAASLCILKPNDSPVATWSPPILARRGVGGDHWLGRGHRLAPRYPRGSHPGALPAARPLGSGLALPSPWRPVPLALSRAPARPASQPSPAAGLRTGPRGSAWPKERTLLSPEPRPTDRTPVLERGVTPSSPRR